MWIRQCDLDAQVDETLPIPARIASNEEFIPPPQTPEQKQYEARLLEIGGRAAKRQGLDRRSFFRTGSGVAAALLALNQVFGECYDVSAEEAELEAQVAAAIVGQGSMAAFDGTLLRRAFAFLKEHPELLTLLLSLLKGG